MLLFDKDGTYDMIKDILKNYENDELPSAAENSLEKLIGWLSANNGISVKSNIKFQSKSLDNSVIGHRNVASTACPGKNMYKLMPEIRTSAENFAGFYGNYAYQIPGDGEKYEITDGKRYSGSVKSSVATISKTQLEAYPADGAAETGSGSYSYPSGTLLKSGEKRGVLENGVLRVIGSSSVLESSYNGLNFVEVTEEKWNSYSNGPAAIFRSGTFVKDESGGYYILEGNQKRKLDLPSEEWGLIDLGAARDVSDSEIVQYLEGGNISSATGFPESVVVTSDNKNYYYISGSRIKKKITKNVFQATFSSSMAVKVSGELLKQYKTKGKLAFQNGAVVSYHGKYVFIENGKRRQFATKSLAKRMGYQNIRKAKRAEMSGIGKGVKIE